MYTCQSVGMPVNNYISYVYMYMCANTHICTQRERGREVSPILMCAMSKHVKKNGLGCGYECSSHPTFVGNHYWHIDLAHWLLAASGDTGDSGNVKETVEALAGKKKSSQVFGRNGDL